MAGPGRAAVLTSGTDRVIGLVKASLVVTARLWQVSPFDTAEGWSGWGLVAHLLVGLGIVGSIVGVISGVAHLVQHPG